MTHDKFTRQCTCVAQCHFCDMLLCIGILSFLSFDHWRCLAFARAFCLTSSSESSEVQDFLPGRSFVDANGRPADTRVKVTRGDSTLLRFNVFNSLNKHESKHEISWYHEMVWVVWAWVSCGVFQICLGSRFPPHSDVFEGHRALRNSPTPPDPCTLSVPQPLEFLQTLQYMN